jgi:hypothetical protein
VGTGSREENASKQEQSFGFDEIGTDIALDWLKRLAQIQGTVFWLSRVDRG